VTPNDQASRPDLPCSGNGALACPRHDLEAARRVQQHLFPGELRLAGWDCAAVCRPARTVAGDYHDLFEAAPSRLAVALGDVSGKGLGPALVAAHLHALVRGRLPADGAALAPFVEDLNRRLLAVLPEGMFVTLLVAVLDLATGRAHYVNAGHPPAQLLLPSGRAQEWSEGGIVLGVLPEAPYRVGQAHVPVGGLLALFSDGLTDAAGLRGQPFHARRVGKVLRRARPGPARTALARLLEAVDAFAAGTEQADDVSVLLVRRQSDTMTEGPLPPSQRCATSA
jgi:sigma-B regulation protein RsbU (phosphoserine phosphatase)